jgi:hypothetical protein
MQWCNEYRNWWRQSIDVFTQTSYERHLVVIMTPLYKLLFFLGNHFDLDVILKKKKEKTKNTPPAHIPPPKKTQKKQQPQKTKTTMYHKIPFKSKCFYYSLHHCIMVCLYMLIATKYQFLKWQWFFCLWCILKYCVIKRISHYSIDAPGQLLKVSVAYWAPTSQCHKKHKKNQVFATVAI